jgi:hypothetical protein
MGTCPKCDKPVSSVTTCNVEVNTIPSPGHTWRGVEHCCPSCGCILGVQIDPVALKTDIVEEILHALGKD